MTNFLIMHMNRIAEILALAPAPSGSQSGQQQNPLMMVMPLILVMVAFYFIAIRPQQKRAKEQAKMISALKAGDEVVTMAGLVGKVISVKEKTVMLRTGESKIEVSKASVTEVTTTSTETTTTVA